RSGAMMHVDSGRVVTKLDVLDELSEIPVCLGYKINGKKTDEIPAQASGYDKIEGIYENKPGLKSSTQGITAMGKLPKQAREYLTFLETATGARVGMVSTGPDRDHTILVDEFAAELKA